MEVLKDDDTYDADIAGEVYRDLLYPKDIVVVVESRTMSEVVTALEDAGYIVVSLNDEDPDYAFIIKGIVETPESDAPFTVYSAKTGEYAEKLTLYRANPAEFEELQQGDQQA